MLNGVVSTMQQLRDMEYNSLILEKLKQAQANLERANSEEESAYESLPANLRFSRRADILTDNLDDLADAMVDIEEVIKVYETESKNPYTKAKKSVLSVIKSCTKAIERV